MACAATTVELAFSRPALISCTIVVRVLELQVQTFSLHVIMYSRAAVDDTAQIHPHITSVALQSYLQSKVLKRVSSSVSLVLCLHP